MTRKQNKNRRRRSTFAELLDLALITKYLALIAYYIYEIIMQNSQGGFQSYEKILHRLIPKIQPKKILEYAKFLLEIPQFDWCKDYVKKAAESLEPWEIIKYTETLIKTDKNWATQKLKEASVGAAPKYILASGKALLSLGPWAEDIIKKAASEANSRELIENRFTLLETDRDWAVPLIKSAAEKTPIEFADLISIKQIRIKTRKQNYTNEPL